MDTSLSEVDSLRIEVAELRRTVAVLLERLPGQALTPLPAAAVFESSRLPGFEPPSASGRRGFLRLAGAAAVGATAAAIASPIEPVAAITGGNLIIGQVNAASAANDTTRLIAPSVTTLDDQTFMVQNYTSGSLTPPTDHRVAVAGLTSGPDLGNGFRTGVYGRVASPAGLGGQGVFGSANGQENAFTSSQIGVFGSAAQDGLGVVGINDTTATSIGVLGRANQGYGVVGSSTAGVSLYARDGGRILQALRTSLGAPTVGSFAIGETIRDAAGLSYICVESGSPGTWQKVTAQHPSYADAGGSLNLLPRPIRLVDTRGGAPITNGSAKAAPGVTLTAQITGTVADGLSVPAGAKGILGNLTATDPDGSGFAVVWPAGQTKPATSNINYSSVTGNPAIANYFISAISPSGGLSIQTAVTASHILVDVFGFVY